MDKNSLPLLQWLKLRGLYPEIFAPQDTFLVVGDPQPHRTLMSLSEGDYRRGFVWNPAGPRLADYLMKEHQIQTEVKPLNGDSLFLVRLKSAVGEFEGSGRTETDAIVRALQTREEVHAG